MSAIYADLRYAFRMLAKDRGFAVVAVITLALGIGANTAIFSVIDAVLLRPLPYPKPNQIVRVWEQARNGHRMHLSDPDFEDFRNQNHTLASLAEYAYGEASIAGGSEPVRVDVAEVSRDFFNAMGVQPYIGRAFSAGELQLHGAPAMIVSYGYWQEYLGSTRDLSQLHLSMDGKEYAVVGVMPRGFNFPAGVAAWFPRELDEVLPSRTAHNWSAVGRVRDGFTVEQARSDLDAIARRIRQQYGKQVDLTDAAVVSLADAMVGDVRTALLTLFGAVGLLLLVACANVAGLLLARTAARSREFAVRTALGARRGRLIRQFLAESAVLSLAGSALGVLVAVWVVNLLPAILPASFPRSEAIRVNGPILLFTLAATCAVALGLGLFGALRAGTANLHESLSAGSRGNSEAGASQRVRAVLVVSEIAATLVILAGAGLLGRSFLRLISVSPGFRQEHLMLVQFSPPESEAWTDVWPQGLPPGQIPRIHFVDNVLSRMRRIPGVEAVGFTGGVPSTTGCADGQFLLLNGQRPPANFKEWDSIAQNPDNAGHADYCVASAGYFKTMGIPLLRGRVFEDQDGTDAANVAVISETLARNRWPNRNPIGQVIEFGNMDGDLKPLTIVGIVGDVRIEGLDHPPTPIIYVDYEQRGLHGQDSTVLIRSAAPPGAIASTARGIVHDVDPNVPVQFSTFADALGGWLADRRFLLLLVGIFAATALALAAVGLYGIVSYSVTRRTQEIGIRAALGAQRMDVLRLIVGEGARLAAIGIAVGLVLSFALTRLISSLLFGVTAADPLTFALVAALLCGVALLASYIPGRRAMRVDPMVALRYE
jgi:putative ABC transport system permease protein